MRRVASKIKRVPGLRPPPSVRGLSVVRSLVLFVLVAVVEIGGAWLVWPGVREHRAVASAGAGVAALGAYGFVATLQDHPHFGRMLAACGGIFGPALSSG